MRSPLAARPAPEDNIGMPFGVVRMATIPACNGGYAGRGRGAVPGGAIPQQPGNPLICR